MKRDLQKTVKIIAALLIMLTPLSMAACGKAETAAPVSAEVLVDETETGPKPAAASAEEIHPFENILVLCRQFLDGLVAKEGRVAAGAAQREPAFYCDTELLYYFCCLRCSVGYQQERYRSYPGPWH